MKTIVLMRHAKAEQDSEKSDFERELTADGIRVAGETGTAFRSIGLSIDRIIASSSARTRQTANLVAEAMQSGAERQDLDELYLARPKQIKDAIRGQETDDETSVLIVGHNPGIASVICRWADESLAVPPATVAVFESTADTWADVRRKAGHAPALVFLLRDGKVVWRRDATTSEPE